MIKPNSNMFWLKREEDKKRTAISLKKLYRLVYDREYCIDEVQSLEGEEWKEIPHTSGVYQASNKGRIKSLQGYSAIVLKPYYTNGYQRVDICMDGGRKSWLVHRLIAMCWLPLPQDISYQLHHKDMNLDNNASGNLVWLSQTEHLKLHREINKKKES